MTRRNFCNARATPLTEQTIDVMRLISLITRLPLGIPCRSRQFLPVRPGKKKPALLPAPVLNSQVLSARFLRSLQALHDGAIDLNQRIQRRPFARDAARIFGHPQRQGDNLGGHILGQGVAVVHAVGSERAPQLAIPVHRLDQRSSGGVGFLGGEQRTGDLAEQPVFGYARIFGGGLGGLIGVKAHS